MDDKALDLLLRRLPEDLKAHLLEALLAYMAGEAEDLDELMKTLDWLNASGRS
jgi:hypothetical protein